MGTGTSLKTRTRKSSLAWTTQFDSILLLVVLTLLTFGLLMLYSASWDFSLLVYDSPTRIFQRQVMWLGLGLVGALALSWLDYRLWRRLALPAMGATLFLLLAVLAAGNLRLGATRNLLGGSVQPSELAKLVTIVYLAVWLDSRREAINEWDMGLLPMGTILGIVGGLILLEPDLSAAGTILLLGGLLFFLGGGDWKRIAVLLGIAVVIGSLLIAVSPTGRVRINTYLEGLRDPLSSSYHVQRALEAFARGGWFGVGIGRSESKLTGLPVPPTDSIFAVIGEETGILGASGVVMLYIVLVWRSLIIARQAPDLLGQVLAAGLGGWIGLEAMINMAVMVGLMPFAGNALPFISAGGSSLVTTLAATGIIFSVGRTTQREKAQKEHKQHAVVDLRRRNRRRSVSGAGRPASTHK
ncbi:MAG: cell division protein FtsW [Anaerolineae bacterium]|nr:MAG: cell division protein FtsW [Anaerolineae bacterium]